MPSVWKGVLLLTAAVAPAAWAVPPPTSTPVRQPGPAAREDRRTFDLRPVAPATPALRFSFAADPVDRLSGDAAPVYLRAAALLPADAARAFGPHNEPPADVAVADDLLRRCGPTFDLIDRATRMGRCEWDTSPATDRANASTPPNPPHLNAVRLLANLLSLRAERRLTAGDTDGVAAAVRQLFTLGEQSARGAGYVGGLVGLGIEATAVDRAVDLMNRPTAPNLYWAVARLPRPVIRFADAIADERRWLWRAMPVLAKGRHPERITAGDWAEWVEQFRALGDSRGADGDGWTALSLSMRMLPAANRWYFATHVRTTTRPTTVPTQLVLATYAIGQFQAVVDEQDKLLSLPHPQLCVRWWQAFDELDRNPGNPVADVLLWTLQSAPRPFARAERAVAALTVVEALRTYAAAHGGRLPDRLADVAEVPVPDNPATGKPFDYQVVDGLATVADRDSPACGGDPLVYTVRLRRP